MSADVATAVKNAKAGQVQYRTDKAGIVQCTIGRASFTPDQLKTNLMALIDALNKSRPKDTKGIYLRKISVSSTMGAGVRVDTGLAQQAPRIKVRQSFVVRRTIFARGLMAIGLGRPSPIAEDKENL